jgi:hypothetical protein
MSARLHARRDLGRRLVFRHRPAVRRNAASRSVLVKMRLSRGQRVLDRLSGARAVGRAMALALRLSAAADGTSRKAVVVSLRIKPPPLAAVARSKLSFQICYKVSPRRPNIRRWMPHHLYLARSSTLCSFTFRCGEPRYPARILFCEASRFERRQRNFDTKYPLPYCYEWRPDRSLESVANLHTAADLHVRPDSSIALI